MLEAVQKLYRNTLFRLTLLAAFLFVASSLLTLGYIYYATVSADLRRVDKALVVEITELEELFEVAGPNLVDDEIFSRAASGDGYYLYRYGVAEVGNFDAIGSAGEEAFKFQDLERGFLPGRDNEYTRFKLLFTRSFDDDGEPLTEGDFVERRLRGMSTVLQQNDEPVGIIIVARDVEITMRNAERIRTAIVVSALIALLLGLLSAFFVSRRFSQRIESFNKLAYDVKSGNMQVRAERNYSEDELDQLAENLNDMLDHIDRLMSAMRYAGDSIAHDLRSPLTRLRTRLDTAAQDADGTTARVLTEASEDASQLLTTFDSVLRIARLESADRREILQPANPAPLVEDLVELYEPSFEDAGLSFELEADPDCVVLADRGLLSQAVSNLIENAIKYTPRGGRVKISLSRTKGGATELSVADTGPGIPEHLRERVKERFVRLQQSRTLPGSGLGLALVDAIAELHKAEVVLDSGLGDMEAGEAPGLEVCLKFPKVRSPRRPAKKPFAVAGSRLLDASAG